MFLCRSFLQLSFVFFHQQLHSFLLLCVLFFLIYSSIRSLAAFFFFCFLFSWAIVVSFFSLMCPFLPIFMRHFFQSVFFFYLFSLIFVSLIKTSSFVVSFCVISVSDEFYGTLYTFLSICLELFLFLIRLVTCPNFSSCSPCPGCVSSFIPLLHVTVFMLKP